MKRDLDLIRDLLLIIESADSNNPMNPYGIRASMPRVQHHLHLLVEAGFVRGVGETADGSISVRLTWQGYEFLELIRDESMWRRVKRHVHSSTHGINVDVLKTTLKDQMVKAIAHCDRWKLENHGDRTRIGLSRNMDNNGHENGKSNGRQNLHHGSRVRTHKPVAQAKSVDRPTRPIAPPLDPDTHFQFHVYNGSARGSHVDSLPLYLL